jgi:hypothetical protein
MRRTTVIAGSVVAALGIGAVAAVSGGAQAPQGQTLTFVSKGGSFKFVDAPPKARSEEDASSGDAFLISVGLYNASNKRVGTLDARCTFTKGGKNLRGICDGIYAIGKTDELHVIARLSADDDVSGSVVGGTGAYAGARGTFTSIDRPGEANGDPSDETITLLP